MKKTFRSIFILLLAVMFCKLPVVVLAQSSTNNAATNQQQQGANDLDLLGDDNLTPAQKTARKNRTIAEYHYHLADEYFRKCKFELSEIELDQAVMYAPNFKAAHRSLFFIEILRLHPVRAFAEFLVVVDICEGSALNDTEKAKLNHNAMRLHYKEGIQLGYAKNWTDAISEFQLALTYEPNNPAIEHSIAFAYANLGKFDQAEEHYSTSLSLNPKDAFAHADYAELLADNGQQAKALEQMSEATKLDPTAAALHVDLGWMAEAKGDLTTAQSEFEKAVQLSPQHAALWTHLGKILEREDKSPEAVFAYKKALEIDSKYDEARQHIASLKIKEPTK